MKIDWKKLIISIAIPLGVGGLAALLTRGGYETFGELNQPPLSPPAWLFPVVWSILYVLMGISSYRILTAVTTGEKMKNAILVYGVQLFFNFVWPIIFFNMGKYLFAFIWLCALWILIFVTWQQFSKIDKIAGWLFIPYLIWVAFAGYLNFGIYLLN